MGPKQTEQLKDRNSKVWKSIENYHSNSLSKDRYSNGKERHSHVLILVPYHYFKKGPVQYLSFIEKNLFQYWPFGNGGFRSSNDKGTGFNGQIPVDTFSVPILSFLFDKKM